MEAHFVETELVNTVTGERINTCDVTCDEQKKQQQEDQQRVELTGWPIGNAWRYPQPRTLQQRMEHAQRFRQLFHFPDELEFCVDTMQNSFNGQYAAWPDSAYVMHKGKLVYRSHVEDEGLRSKAFTVQIDHLLEKLQ